MLKYRFIKTYVNIIKKTKYFNIITNQPNQKHTLTATLRTKTIYTYLNCLNHHIFFSNISYANINMNIFCLTTSYTSFILCTNNSNEKREVQNIFLIVLRHPSIALLDFCISNKK